MSTDVPDSGVALSPKMVLGGLGAAAMVISSFLKWQDLAGTANFKGTDVPVAFLVDRNTNSSSPSLLLLFAVAAAVIAVGIVTSRRFSIFGGGALGVIGAALFAVQAQGLIDDRGADVDLFDFLGIGVYVALVGGILAIVASLIPDTGAGNGADATPSPPPA